MDTFDPNEPIYKMNVRDVHVATLFDPRFEEMFWCSYRIKPTSEDADLIIHHEKLWETVDFTIIDLHGRSPNPNTFSGGYHDFCDRKSDRLSFRSLWPPSQSCTPSWGSRLRMWVLSILGIRKQDTKADAKYFNRNTY